MDTFSALRLRRHSMLWEVRSYAGLRCSWELRWQMLGLNSQPRRISIKEGKQLNQYATVCRKQFKRKPPALTASSQYEYVSVFSKSAS